LAVAEAGEDDVRRATAQAVTPPTKARRWPAPRSEDEEAQALRAKKKKPPKQRRSRAALWVVCGAAVLLTGVAVAALLIFGGRRGEPGPVAKGLPAAQPGGPKLLPQRPGVAKGAGGEPQRDNNLAEWATDPALSGQFQEEVLVPRNPGYSFRPPKAYLQSPLDLSPEAATFLSGARWESPARPDGSVTRLLIMMGKAQPGEALPPLGDFAADVLGTRSNMVGPLQKGQLEYGKIAGLVFARQRWQARHPVSGLVTHGFVYVARDGLQEVAIDTQDIEPHATATLPLAEAAALTFRRAKGNP
jgi:hypothetical protein